MLDEAFRRRVGALAESDESRLSDETRERIVRHVVAEGPGLVGRARRQRMLAMVALPALAAAAAIALVTVRHEVRPAPAATALTVTNQPACATRGIAEAARRGFVRDDSGQKLDLGAVAYARASSDSDVRLVEISSCRTTLELATGTVAVHAKDLGGGELAVRARGGEVRVRGTIFAVTQTGDSLSVEVVEGHVIVSRGSAKLTVDGGERVLVSELGVARGAIGQDRSREIRNSLNGPSVVGFDALELADPSTGVHKPGSVAGVSHAKPGADVVELASGETTDTDLLAQAELSRRGHDYARARELYKEAAEAGGATGEAAWVALARMELGLGRAAAALDATKRRRERFGQGTLGPEALWIDVRSYRLEGEQERARTLAKELVRTWPSSPQARAAEQWLSAAP